MGLLYLGGKTLIPAPCLSLGLPLGAGLWGGEKESSGWALSFLKLCSQVGNMYSDVDEFHTTP